MSNTGRSSRRKSKSVSVKPSRKTRTKTRKPKYLSLVHLDENQPLMAFKNSISNGKKSHRQPPPQQQQQLNLFPLHPENLVEDKDTQYDNVCLLFNSTEEDNVHAVSLNGILDDESSDFKNETTTATTTSEDSPLSPCSTYGGGYSGEDHTRWLVESAMKGKKGRYESEEKWVVYSEVVEKKEMEEVSSCGGDGGGDGGGGAWCMISSSKKKMKKLLALKLDYEEIMNAWSDKGPLYIEGGDQSPQTVPNLHDAAAATVVGDAWGNASIDVWRVPEVISNDVGGVKIKEEVDGTEDWKRGHREASVLRYKEKRQNRLFAKRIRYEVRKVNAEKRPRLKGRFVKRD